MRLRHAMLTLLAIGDAAFARDAASLDTLPAPTPSVPLAAADPRAAAIDGAVRSHARGTYAVQRARRFLVSASLSWQPIVHRVANAIRAAGGEPVPIPWQDPGIDPVALFQLPDGSGLCVVMSHPSARAASRAVGYYRVRFRPAALQ